MDEDPSIKHRKKKCAKLQTEIWFDNLTPKERKAKKRMLKREREMLEWLLKNKQEEKL
jgi:hypothetical protein